MDQTVIIKEYVVTPKTNTVNVTIEVYLLGKVITIENIPVQESSLHMIASSNNRLIWNEDDIIAIVSEYFQRLSLKVTI